MRWKLRNRLTMPLVGAMAAVWASCLTGEDPPDTGFVQLELQYVALDCENEPPGIPSSAHVEPRECEALRSIQAMELRLSGIEAKIKRKNGGVEWLTLDSGEQVLHLVKATDRLPGFIGIYELPVGELQELAFDVEGGTATFPANTASVVVPSGKLRVKARAASGFPVIEKSTTLVALDVDLARQTELAREAEPSEMVSEVTVHPILFGTTAHTALANFNRFVRGQALVLLGSSASRGDLDDLNATLGGRVVATSERVPNLFVVRINDLDAVQVAAAYRDSNFVEAAIPDIISSADIDPSDLHPRQDNLANTGAFGGVPDADIDAPLAWDIETGSRTVRVAVLDSGMDLQHPELVPNTFLNPAELPASLFDVTGGGGVPDGTVDQADIDMLDVDGDGISFVDLNSDDFLLNGQPGACLDGLMNEASLDCDRDASGQVDVFDLFDDDLNVPGFGVFQDGRDNNGPNPANPMVVENVFDDGNTNPDDFVGVNFQIDDGQGFTFPQEQADATARDSRIAYHGSRVAGIIGALANNTVPGAPFFVLEDENLVGVNWEVSMIPIRVFNNMGNGLPRPTTGGGGVVSPMLTWFDAVERAAAYGATVANYSGGSTLFAASVAPDSDQDGDGAPDPGVESIPDEQLPQIVADLQTIFDAVTGGNMLLVSSAGNIGTNLSPSNVFSWPAELEGALAVASVDNRDVRSKTSSFGSSVELAAPGVLVFSTARSGLSLQGMPIREDFSGTSAAAPHVSAAAALLWALDDELTPAQVVDTLCETADPLPPIDGMPVASCGRLNVGRALHEAVGIPFPDDGDTDGGTGS